MREKSGVSNGIVLGCANGLEAGSVAEAVAAAFLGAATAPVEAVATVVERALTSDRPRTRYVVGRDAHIRAAIERLPDRLRDRVYERLLLRS
jgi:hypothetical protein